MRPANSSATQCQLCHTIMSILQFTKMEKFKILFYHDVCERCPQVTETGNSFLLFDSCITCGDQRILFFGTKNSKYIWKSPIESLERKRAFKTALMLFWLSSWNSTTLRQCLYFLQPRLSIMSNLFMNLCSKRTLASV